MLHIEQQTQQGKMSGKSSKNKRPIICAARPKQLYFKLPYFMGAFICFFSLFFAIYGGVWKQSHTIPIIIHHIEYSHKIFSSRIVKKCTSCTFFNSKFVKQTCYCVEPRTSCPIVVVPPFFQNYTAPLHILPVRFRRNGRLTQRPQLLNLAGKSGMDAAGSTQQRRLRLRLKLVDEKCTRMYIFHQGRETSRKP